MRKHYLYTRERVGRRDTGASWRPCVSERRRDAGRRRLRESFRRRMRSNPQRQTPTLAERCRGERAEENQRNQRNQGRPIAALPRLTEEEGGAEAPRHGRKADAGTGLGGQGQRGEATTRRQTAADAEGGPERAHAGRLREADTRRQTLRTRRERRRGHTRGAEGGGRPETNPYTRGRRRGQES